MCKLSCDQNRRMFEGSLHRSAVHEKLREQSVKGKKDETFCRIFHVTLDYLFIFVFLQFVMKCDASDLLRFLTN